MKWIFFFLLFCFSLQTFGQEKKKAIFFPDTLQAFGLSTSFQNEDIYSYFHFQLPIVKNILLDAALGLGWRHALTNSAWQPSIQIGFHYDFLQQPKLNLGPSLRFSYTGPRDKSEEKPQLNFYNADLGYRFSYGGKLKVMQSSYAGAHQFWYVETSGTKDGVVYFGYAFQVGLSFEL